MADPSYQPSSTNNGGGGGGNGMGTPPSNTAATKKNNYLYMESNHDSSLIPTLGVFLWLGWVGTLVYLGSFLLLYGGTTGRVTVLVSVVTSLILPPNFPNPYGYMIGDWMMRCGERYFGLKTTVEDCSTLNKLSSEGKSIIFAFEPHDVLPFSVFAFSPTLNRLPGFISPHHNREHLACLMTSAVFQVPFMRQVYTWAGGLPVDKSTFMKRLRSGKASTFVPGGVQEVSLMDPARPNDLILYLKNRKGFIKLALTTGTAVVPTFCFGLDGTYGYWFPKGELVLRFSRLIGFVPLLFWGRWGIPFGIPYPKQIHVVVGKHIDIPCEGEGKVRQESIEKYHALFLQEMEALFERHKEEAGYGHRTLKIM